MAWRRLGDTPLSSNTSSETSKKIQCSMSCLSRFAADKCCRTGPWFSNKILSDPYNKSHCGEKTSYLPMVFPIPIKWHLYIESAPHSWVLDISSYNVSCKRNASICNKFTTFTPHKGPGYIYMRNVDVFYAVSLKLLNKQSSVLWFETAWRLCDAT